MKTFIFALLLAPLSALACVQSVDSNDVFAEVCIGTDLCKTIVLADLTQRSVRKREQEVRQSFQDFLDFRVPLTTLDIDEETRGVNPNCENFYWSDDRGQASVDSVATHIVAHDCVVDSVVWDGVLGLFIITIRRADRCQ